MTFNQIVKKLAIVTFIQMACMQIPYLSIPGPLEAKI